MDLKNDTKDLSRTLEGMEEKTRALNDSLQHLAREGFAALEKAASPKPAARGRETGTDDIVKSELTRFIKQELLDGLKNILGNTSGAAGGGMNVVIHNHTAAAVTARETNGAFDRKYLEITIDQMVADSLVRGRQTSSVMRSLFGIAPSLLGR